MNTAEDTRKLRLFIGVLHEYGFNKQANGLAMMPGLPALKYMDWVFNQKQPWCKEITAAYVIKELER